MRASEPISSTKEWGKDNEERLSAECQERVEAAVAHYLATSPRLPESIFDHLHAELPHTYVGQRNELKGASDA